jgi:aldose 1-epimerase
MYRVNIKEHVNPSLNQIIITNKELNFESIIFPNLGASLQKLSRNRIDIIDGIKATKEELKIYGARYNSSFLFPFPSRIEDGKYSFNGQDYQLDINDTSYNNAIHGLIYNKPFKLKNKLVSNSKAKLKLNYKYKGDFKGFPFPYKLSLIYIFSEENVKVKFNIENTGATEFPFGIGWHPYFKTTDLSNSTLNFNGKSEWILNDRLLPLKETNLSLQTPIKIEETELDNCFVTNEPKGILKTGDYAMKMKFSSAPPNSFLQVYTPPTRDSIAIEPMTCGGNCFNSKIGLQTLKPKETYNWKISLNF